MPLDTDIDGILPTSLRQTLQAAKEACAIDGSRPPRVLYTVPTGQNPTGACSSTFSARTECGSLDVVCFSVNGVEGLSGLRGSPTSASLFPHMIGIDGSSVRTSLKPSPVCHVHRLTFLTCKPWGVHSVFGPQPGSVHQRSQASVFTHWSAGAGLTCPIERKAEIYAVCAEYDVIILEDDPYWYLQFGQSEPSSTHWPFVVTFDHADYKR